MDLKIKKIKKKRMIVKIVKIYLGLSLMLLVGHVGSVHFRTVPWSGLYLSRSIGSFLYSQYQRQGFNLLHLSLPRRFTLF